MQKGISLADFARKIEFNRDARKDFIVETRKGLAMQIDDYEEPPIGNAKTPIKKRRPVLELYGTRDAERFPMLDLVHNQLGTYVGIPAKYYDRMLEKQPDLLAMNVNSWLKHDLEREADKRMLRTLHGNARGFLSNRYSRIDNHEIADVALPILAELPNVKIVSCEVTDKRMYIQAVTPAIEGEIKKGDVVQAGVLITNSEVGCGSVSVSSVIWRLICLNGMKGMDRFRANHVGRKIDDNEDLWSDSTRKLDDKLVLSKVRDMVKSAVDENRFRKQIEHAQMLTGIKVEKDPQAAVVVLSQKVGVSDEESSGILKSLIEGGDLSAWGLLNAVTHQAHTAKNYDRAVEFEEAGGQMMNWGKADWKQVLEATALDVKKAA